MTPETVLTIAQQALTVATILAAPLLLGALATGLVIGVLQAATQINEMTLSFIPKLLALVLTLVLAGPWMLREIMYFTTTLIASIPEMIG
jgi:flagellar biosynthetic protein FliQ